MWSYPFFSGLSYAQLDLLTPATRRITVPKNELLFTEGHNATHIYVIVRGQLALEMASHHRPRVDPFPVTVGTLGPTQAVGFWALINPYLYAFTARALQPLDCLAIDGEILRKAMAADAKLGMAIMEKVSEQLLIRLDQAREALGYQRKLLGSPYAK